MTRRLRHVALVALLAACGKAGTSTEAPAAADVPDAAAPIVDAAAPAARTIPPYPPGPYGTGVGEVMPNFEIVGYALSREESDSTHLPFRAVSLAEARTDGCTCMVVALTANGTQCFPSIMHDRNLTALLAKNPSLCAVEVSVYNHDGTGPDVSPQDQPPTRSDIDAFTQSGRENYPVGIPTKETRRALSAFAITMVPTSYIVRATDMRILSMVIGAGDSFERDLPTICATQQPPVERIATGVAPRNIATDGTYVYATDAALGIVRVPAAGGAVDTIAPADGTADAIALDSTYVYWATHDGATNAIARVPKLGGTPEVLLTSPSGFFGIAVDGDRVHFTRSDGVVGSVALADHAVTTLATSEASPTAVVADDAHVYWIASGKGEVARAPKGGGAREPLLADDGFFAPAGRTAHATRLGFMGTALLVGSEFEIYSVPKAGGAPVGLTQGNVLENRGFAVLPDGAHLLAGTREPFDHMGVVQTYLPSRSTRVPPAVNLLTAGQENVGTLVTDGAYAFWTTEASAPANRDGTIRRMRLQ